MIVTVTMNPAIDKTVDIERMERGGLNRIKRVVLDAGGKGINVSKQLKNWDWIQLQLALSEERQEK